MVTLESSFESDLREAVLEEAEQEFIGRRANLAFEFVELVHELLRAYGERHGYDVESTIDSLGEPQVKRSGDRLTITVGWNSPQMARWEWGVEPHTITGSPLHFYWEETDQWVMTDKVNWGSETGGIPESRAIRDALNQFERGAHDA